MPSLNAFLHSMKILSVTSRSRMSRWNHWMPLLILTFSSTDELPGRLDSSSPDQREVHYSHHVEHLHHWNSSHHRTRTTWRMLCGPCLQWRTHLLYWARQLPALLIFRAKGQAGQRVTLGQVPTCSSPFFGSTDRYQIFLMAVPESCNCSPMHMQIKTTCLFTACQYLKLRQMPKLNTISLMLCSQFH